jgi:hypothetical protein
MLHEIEAGVMNFLEARAGGAITGLGGGKVFQKETHP